MMNRVMSLKKVSVALRHRGMATAVEMAVFENPTVNGTHIPSELPARELAPLSNKTGPVSTSHWDEQWGEDRIKSAIQDNVMATWGPSSTMKHVPLIVKGEGIYLYDNEGKEYIDWTSQAVCTNIGHTVPETVATAVDDQMRTLPFLYGGLGMSEIRARLSSLLSELTPGDLNGFLFPSGGSDANEAAIRIARGYTGKHKVLSHYRSYHGGTTSSLAATGDFRRWFGEAGATGFIKCFGPSPFHFSMGESDDEVAERSLNMLEEQILMEGPNTIAAMLMESIVGAGGCLILPEKYVQGVRSLCDKYGIVLIMDEVMMGFGRTGTFWGFQHYDGVVPDIVTSAKGLTGSYLPLAMVAVRQPIKDFFEEKSIGWGSTYQAHPVALRCAYECIKYTLDNDLVGNSKRMEAVMIEETQKLVDNHPSVLQGRAKGLFGCVDTVDPSGRLTQNLQGPMPPANAAFKRALLEEGLYGLLRLPLVHTAPPLIITEPQLRDGFQRFSTALDRTLDREFRS